VTGQAGGDGLLKFYSLGWRDAAAGRGPHARYGIARSFNGASGAWYLAAWATATPVTARDGAGRAERTRCAIRAWAAWPFFWRLSSLRRGHAPLSAGCGALSAPYQTLLYTLSS